MMPRGMGERKMPLDTSRGCTRFARVAPVVCSWGPTKYRRVLQGMTRDISIHGIFVASPDCPPLSSVVRCQVHLPPLSGAAKPVRPVILRTVGRVVRTDDRGAGFAIHMKTPVLWDSESLSRGQPPSPGADSSKTH